MNQTTNGTSANKNFIEDKISTNGKGMGFIKDPAGGDDIVIEPDKMNTALPGDTVRISLLAMRDNRKQGEVVAILSRAREQFVGTVAKEAGATFVKPDNFKVYTSFLLNPESAEKVEPEQKVLIRMIEWKKEDPMPKANLLKIFGHKGEHEVEMQSIIFEKGFIADFPEELEKAAQAQKQKWSPSPDNELYQKEIANRFDLREEDVMTIDPADAKDFDDALHVKKLDNGNYEVGVHIADVSHFVTPNSELDKEAINRATSVYLVDRTIPMLPETLSNDLCSLNPDEEKFAFSTIFELNANADVLSRKFGKSVIKSKKRFTYEEAQAVLDAQTGPYVEELNILNTLAKKLGDKKRAAGAIEFEKDEIKFELDKEGRPLRVIKKERMDTHKLVEEMMLLSNREVAKFIFDKGKENKNQDKLMYRIHDVPNIDKIADLANLVKTLGYFLPVNNEGEVSVKDLNLLLNSVDGKPEESLIKTAAIRTMSKAIYSMENTGHFGLAFQYYTHFTSPIRRYPDLVVHRIVYKYIHGEKLEQSDIAIHERAATVSTEREISAAEAERESVRYKQAEYMQDHIGEIFEGVISGVSPWGIYVQTTDTLTEGMVHISKLGNDFYNFDEKNFRIVGEKDGAKFTLGDPVKIKIEAIDLDQKKIDMALAK